MRRPPSFSGSGANSRPRWPEFGDRRTHRVRRLLAAADPEVARAELGQHLADDVLELVLDLGLDGHRAVLLLHLVPVHAVHLRVVEALLEARPRLVEEVAELGPPVDLDAAREGHALAEVDRGRRGRAVDLGGPVAADRVEDVVALRAPDRAGSGPRELDGRAAARRDGVESRRTPRWSGCTTRRRASSRPATRTGTWRKPGSVVTRRASPPVGGNDVDRLRPLAARSRTRSTGRPARTRGRRRGAGSRVICSSRPESSSSVQMSRFPLRSELKTSFSPSGDHEWKKSSALCLVSWRFAPVFRSSSQMLLSPPLSDWYAMRAAVGAEARPLVLVLALGQPAALAAARGHRSRCRRGRRTPAGRRPGSRGPAPARR